MPESQRGKYRFPGLDAPDVCSRKRTLDSKTMIPSPLSLASLHRVRDSVTSSVPVVDAMDFSDGDDRFQTPTRDDRNMPTRARDIRIPDVERLTTDGAPAGIRRRRNKRKDSQTTVRQLQSAGCTRDHLRRDEKRSVKTIDGGKPKPETYTCAGQVKKRARSTPPPSPLSTSQARFEIIFSNW